LNRQDLITLAVDIVAAHVANNNVAISDMPTLVERVFGALESLDCPPAPPAVEEKKPMVSVRASVKPDYLVCLSCGRKQKTLKRHLMSAHGLTPEQYRSDFGLPAGYPMAAPAYSEQRRAMAKSAGLGRRRSKTVRSQGGPARKASGRRPRSSL